MAFSYEQPGPNDEKVAFILIAFMSFVVIGIVVVACCIAAW